MNRMCWKLRGQQADVDFPRRLPAERRRVWPVHGAARAKSMQRAAGAQSRRDQLAHVVLSRGSRNHLRAHPRRQPSIRLAARAESHGRRRHHEQRGRVRHGRSLLDGQRGHDPGNPLRQHRAVPRAIGILQQRGSSTHLGDRRQRPVHLRSQRPRRPAFRVPGTRAGLRQGGSEHDLSLRACCTTSARSESTTTCCGSPAR